MKIVVAKCVSALARVTSSSSVGGTLAQRFAALLDGVTQTFRPRRR